MIAELAVMTGLNRETLRLYVRRGKLRPLNQPGPISFDEEDALAQIEALGLRPRRKRSGKPGLEDAAEAVTSPETPKAVESPMVNNGLIEDQCTPLSPPPVPTAKEDGTLRFFCALLRVVEFAGDVIRAEIRKETKQ
jgi:hypothetical protein